MADLPAVVTFQPSDDEMGDRRILSAQYPFTAADHLKTTLTPWTMGFFPAPHIKKIRVFLAF